MDGAMIERLLKSDPKCRDVFLGTFPRDRLPKTLSKPSLMICNTDPHDQPGQHWIVIYFRDVEYGEYFDSFGRLPERTFQIYLNKHCRNWIFNDRQLQSLISRFCGHYCVLYCVKRCRGMDIVAITNMFTEDTAVNDYMAHAFVCNHYR